MLYIPYSVLCHHKLWAQGELRIFKLISQYFISGKYDAKKKENRYLIILLVVKKIISVLFFNINRNYLLFLTVISRVEENGCYLAVLIEQDCVLRFCK